MGDERTTCARYEDFLILKRHLAMYASGDRQDLSRTSGVARMRVLSHRPRSVRLDACEIDNLRPFLGVIRDKLGVVGS
jgi:hypothetical protein